MNATLHNGGLLKPDDLAGLGNLELIARAIVDGFMNGLHKSRDFGFSQEFAEYKAYNEGDDTRFIDWGVYGRSDRLFIKRFDGETNTRVTLLLDASASMDFGRTQVSKLDYAKMLIAALAWLAARQHDTVGLTVFDAAVREEIPPGFGMKKLRRLLTQLAAVEARAGTELSEPLQAFAGRRPRRGLVFVVSDFYCDPQALLASLQPLAWTGQDITLLHVLDPDERAPAARDNVLYEDVETGETVEVSKDFLARDYPARIAAHIDAFDRAARAIGATHQVMPTNESPAAALRTYWQRRQARGG
ncbi:MAG: DUF58 domain-containing protein [Pseudomonadota bacterium]